jgi:hypothetical protein
MNITVDVCRARAETVTNFNMEVLMMSAATWQMADDHECEAEASTSATCTTGDTLPAPLSKSAQKKALKATRLAALKVERRAREKLAKKEKKRALAERRANGLVDDKDDGHRSSKRARANDRVEWGGRVVVDLGFDELMSEKVGVCLAKTRYSIATYHIPHTT